MAQLQAAEKYQSWYPSSIALPSGLNYPCALTPLPRDLPGIPAADRAYIDHVYSMILKCVQAKTAMLASLNDPSKVKAAYSRYYYDTKASMDKIRSEPTPKGLESFRNQVLKAIGLQMVFFDKATKQAQARVPFQSIMTIPEGKQASSALIAAWGKMTARYPSWDKATKDSIYHHLCALDLF